MAKVTIKAIQSAVAGHFCIECLELKRRSNSHIVVAPRQMAMYLARQLTAASLSEIGRHFGGKHHTTVIYSIRNVAARCRADPVMRAAVDAIESRLRVGQ